MPSVSVQHGIYIRNIIGNGAYYGLQDSDEHRRHYDTELLTDMETSFFPLAIDDYFMAVAILSKGFCQTQTDKVRNAVNILTCYILLKFAATCWIMYCDT